MICNEFDGNFRFWSGNTNNIISLLPNCHWFMWHLIIRLYICRTISGFPASPKLQSRVENVWNFEPSKTVKFHFCCDILSQTRACFEGKGSAFFIVETHVRAKILKPTKNFIKLKKWFYSGQKKLESEIRNGWLLEIKNYSVLDLRTKIEIISQRSNQIAWKIKYHGSEIKKRQQIQEFWKCQVILIG